MNNCAQDSNPMGVIITYPKENVKKGKRKTRDDVEFDDFLLKERSVEEANVVEE